MAALTQGMAGPLARLAPPSLDVLENGVRVVVSPQPHLQAATVGVFVKAGPRYETAAENGISHFLEHMLFRGTPRHASAYEVSLAAESLGGMIDAATYADFTAYQLTVPGEHAAQALALLADLLSGPRLLDIELEKKIVSEEILADLSEDGREIDPDNLARMMAFGEHPLGFKITGDVAHVDGFTQGDLRRHLATFYCAQNLTVVATGAVERASVVACARAQLSAFARGHAALLTQPAPPRRGERFRVVVSESSQSEVRVLFRAFGSYDPDFVALRVLSRILDDGMSTRLHRRLTDDSGLAYEAYADVEAFEEVGLFEVGASVAHAKVPELVSEVLSLLAELRDEGATQAELDKAKTRYAWTLRSTLDSSEDLAMFVGSEAVFARPPLLQDLLAEVERVELSDVARVLTRVVRPETLQVLSVGKLTRALERQTAARIERFR